jgi:hypothetical protein
VATSCKMSHSSGVSTNLRGIKVFFIPSDEMNREDRFSASELNVVFEVGSCRSKGTLDNRLAQPYQLKSFKIA